MRSYSAYGLRVQADGPIPGYWTTTGRHAGRRAPAAAHAGDLRRHVSRLKWRSPSVAPEPPNLQIRESCDGDYLSLAYHECCEFIISTRGPLVWASWPLHQSMDDVLPYLRGPMFGLLLRLRGVVSLHASAIQVGGKAVALLGPPGAGKSTTAAAFARRGVPILSDDVVPLKERGADFWTVPGYPTVCLWPSSVEMLYGSADALPLIMAGWDKRYLDLEAHGHAFPRDPLPLAAIYVLGERRFDVAAPEIQGLRGNDSLFALLVNTFGAHLSDSAMRARDFLTLGRVAARVPIRRVTPHASPDRLPELCDAILQDASSFA